MDKKERECMLNRERISMLMGEEKRLKEEDDLKSNGHNLTSCSDYCCKLVKDSIIHSI